ncbi:MAG TPA: thiamine diphosphokinase [Ignavibacteria bacterium]|nr:thiamine diphosphokinase [Ignavibacteria bacterium]HMQ98834.1 thiamine diphosphokinase [Ignavibacteria bacterium]
MRSSNLKECLIVCNGKIFTKDLKELFSKIKPRRAITIIACDGASDFLYRNKITPDFIIGDMDSISPKVLNYFRKKNVVIKKIVNQNQNDLEKAIKFALSKKIKNISIIGFAGKRLDHTLNNLSIIKKFFRKARIQIYENGFTGELISRSAEFACGVGSIVSLIPMPKAVGVTTKGLKYPLKSSTLEFGVREGALNEAVGNLFSVKIKSGLLMVLIGYA